jgi:hypothetical protein
MPVEVNTPAQITAYHDRLAPSDQAICAKLRTEIDALLPDAQSKVWHAHPVWFLGGNPIVGYHRLKDCVRLLFWSGQSFGAVGLKAEGKFKAAESRYTNETEIDADDLRQWLKLAREIQWDYKNIVKRKGVLERLM